MKYIFVLLAGLLIAGCGGKSPDEHLKEAESLSRQNKITEAIAEYEKIIHEYPDEPAASEAMYQIAALYQNKSVPNIEVNVSLEKAVELYQNVYEKYPASERAPMSLFLSGFIQANDLAKYDEATAAYNLFLEKYPNHELASSAKEELEFMGLTPEEILAKKSSKEI